MKEKPLHPNMQFVNVVLDLHGTGPTLDSDGNLTLTVPTLVGGLFSGDAVDAITQALGAEMADYLLDNTAIRINQQLVSNYLSKRMR